MSLASAASYVWGDCTYYVAQTLSWVPAGLGNAADWLANAQRLGLPTSSVPVPGSVVVYGSGSGYSPFGHVAIVQAVNADGTFVVSEMNYTGLNQVDVRRSTMADVLGFILPPGSTPAAPSGVGGVGPSVLSFIDRVLWLGLALALVTVGLLLLVAQDLGRRIRDHPELWEVAL
ncbi:MAG TPA: CHAP domain-containing protein [Candidatus Dormibacteraeota bacterium]|nr:CHAP domain-containing protein [Candidatus Dormibacteraeota bacterium]